MDARGVNGQTLAWRVESARLQTAVSPRPRRLTLSNVPDLSVRVTFRNTDPAERLTAAADVAVQAHGQLDTY